MTQVDQALIHATAIVDGGACIGSGTRVWHFCHIFSGAIIGQSCSLGQNTVVHATARIGDFVKIQNNVSIYDGVVLMDHVFCGPSVVFTNVKNPRAEINRRGEFQKTVVKAGATLGANCTIVCGVTIGAYALIGAGAVVLHDVPDHALVIGNPGRQRGWVCVCGLRLQPVASRLQCQHCRRAYHITVHGLTLHDGPFE